MCDTTIQYRRATFVDLPAIVQFVDLWLAGRAKKAGAVNAGDDYFVTPQQHKSYLRGGIVYIALEGDKIVGWGVKGRNNVLIHLLVAGDCRGKGVGSELLKRLNPDVIRSKSDQSTGDPASFYEEHGYAKAGVRKVGKKHNIDLLMKTHRPQGGTGAG